MSTVPPFLLERRGAPLIISIPHLGTHIPDELNGDYLPEAFQLADTDWHLDRLYGFAEALGATVLGATVSRYVIDANRPATGESLYPGIISTTLCPTETFRGEPLYQPGREPGAPQIARRVEQYWKPYHDALKGEIARLRQLHPHILLWEAHSIASVLPRLFAGRLPDFNFGTADGQSCDESVIAGALGAVREQDVSWVLNGRFKGGFITRRYGDPGGGVHAVQLEMCQSLYMDEDAPFAWCADLAAAVTPVVRASVEGALQGLAAAASAGRERHKATAILSR
jgi:N-formylglutamate deformylase